VITPWQSAQLGFYNQNETVLPFEKQPVSCMQLLGSCVLMRSRILYSILTCSWYCLVLV